MRDCYTTVSWRLHLIAPFLCLVLLNILCAQAIAQYTVSGFQPINRDAARDSADDRPAVIAGNGLGNWICVWVRTGFLDSRRKETTRLYFARSSDNGFSWSKPAPLTGSSHKFTVSGANVATNRAGVWVVAFVAMRPGEGEGFRIWTACSTNNGASWGEPVPVSAKQAHELGHVDNASVETDGGGQWVAIWTFDTREVMTSHSSNNATTWSTPVPLVPAGQDIFIGAPAEMATDGAGNWVCAWLQRTSGSKHILVARSQDNGKQWAPALRLPDDPLHVSNPLELQLATDRLGRWSMIYEGQTPSKDHDLLYITSTDKGSSWSKPVVLSHGGKRGPGHARMAVNKEGHWLVLWDAPLQTLELVNGVYMKNGDGGFQEFAQPVAPVPETWLSSLADISPSRSGSWHLMWHTYGKKDTKWGKDWDILAAHLTGQP